LSEGFNSRERAAEVLLSNEAKKSSRIGKGDGGTPVGYTQLPM